MLRHSYLRVGEDISLLHFIAPSFEFLLCLSVFLCVYFVSVPPVPLSASCVSMFHRKSISSSKQKQGFLCVTYVPFYFLHRKKILHAQLTLDRILAVFWHEKWQTETPDPGCTLFGCMFDVRNRLVDSHFLISAITGDREGGRERLMEGGREAGRKCSKRLH